MIYAVPALIGLALSSFLDDPIAKVEVISHKQDGVEAKAINSRGEFVGFEWAEEKGNPDLLNQDPILVRGKETIKLPLIPGYTSTFPMAISDTGLVVGRASKPRPRIGRIPLADQAFYWDAKSGIQGLGALPEDVGSSACGVTKTGGQISGYSYGDNRIRACVWERDGTNWKSTPLPQNGRLGSFVVAISDNGTYVTAVDAIEPCLWTKHADGTWVREVIGEPGSLVPRAVNNSGHVVGLAFTGDGLTHAVMWTRESGVKRLEKPKGYVKSEALAINNKDVVVGMIDGPTGSDIGPNAFVFEKGALRVIDEGGPNFTSATAINDQRQVAGVMEKAEEKAAIEPVQAPKDKP